MTITTDLGEKSLSEIKGVTEVTETSLDTLNETVNKILETITGISQNKLTGEEQVLDFDKVKESIPGAEKDKKGGVDSAIWGESSGKKVVTVDDVAKLPALFASGALLVNGTLLLMSDTLNKILDNMIKNSNLKKTPAPKKKEDKGATKKLKTIDPKQLAEITKGMMGYAKACLILALIPNKLVNAAVNQFDKFVQVMVKNANTISKSGKDFDDFAKGLEKVVNCLKTFAIATVIMAVTLPFTAIAYVTTQIMNLILLSLLKVAKVAQGMTKPLDALINAVKKIAFAMILFGIASMIAITVGRNALDAIKGLVIMTVFMVTAVLLGLLAMYASPVIIGSQFSFIQLAIAAILFGVAIKIIQNIKLEKDKLQGFTDAVKLIVGTFASMMGVIWRGVLSVVGFVLFATLFAGAMVFFVLALGLMYFSTFIINKLWDDKMNDGKGGFKIMVQINNLVDQFANNWKNYLMAALATLGFIVFAIVFTVSMVLFLIATAAMWAIDKLLGPLIEDEKTVRPLRYLDLVSQTMINNVGNYALAALCLVPALAYAVELSAFSALMLVSIAALYAVQKLMDKLGTAEEINGLGKKLAEAGVGIMLGFLGVSHEAGKPIGMSDLALGIKNAGKMALLGLEALIPIAPMALFMVSAAVIGESLKKLQDSLKDVDDKTITLVFGSLKTIMTNLAEFANIMKDTSAETITAVGGLVKDVAQAIGLLTDIVIKLKDGIPEEQIESATLAMKQICEKLFGRPGDSEKGSYTLTTTLETIASADLKNLNAEAVGAIVPLMAGIDRMADLVIKLADPETFSTEKIETGIERLKRFFECMGAVSEAMMGLVKKQDTGERTGGFLGIGAKKVMVSPLEAIQQVNEANFFETLDSTFNKIGNSLNLLQSINVDAASPFVDFMTSGGIATMAVNAPLFMAGMKGFTEGISGLDDKKVENFRKFMEVLGGADSSRISGTIKQLNELGQTATKFKSVADSFERMEKALSKMAKNESKISKIFESMKSGVKEGASLAENTTAAMGGVTINPFVEKIYDVIDDWNTNGIPVRAQMNQATGEILPKNVGNGTGTGGGRS